MTESYPDKNDFPSSQELAAQLGPLLDYKTFALEKADVEINLLRDTPEVLRREHLQAYYETFYDTPAKKLLWQAEQFVGIKNREESEGSKIVPWWLNHFNLTVLNIDIAEAYGHVMPDEGYRVVQSMTESRAKVEALAKFGKATSHDFIQQARDMAVRLSNSHYFGRHNMFLTVAKFADDDLSLEIAYNNLMAERDEEWDSWGHFDTICALASLGHQPALRIAKRQLPRFMKKEATNEAHWIEEAALVEYVDELTQRGVIPTRITIPVEGAPAFESTERTWQDFILEHRYKIMAVMEQGIYLPRFDSLAGEFEFVQHNIERCTSLKTGDDSLEYLNAKIDEYTETIAREGPEIIGSLLHKTKDVDTRYKRSRDELQKEHEEAMAQLKYMGAAHFVPDPSLKGQIAIRDEEFREVLPFLNRIALIKAMALAAIEIAN